MKRALKSCIIMAIFFGPFKVNGQLDKIIIAYNQHEDDKGLELIDQALAFKIKTGEIYYYKTLFELRKKFYNQAIRSAKKGMSKARKDHDMYGNLMLLLSEAYAKSDNLNHAIIYARILTRDYPENTDALSMLGYYYCEAELYKDCFKTLQDVMLIDSQDVSVLQKLAFYSSEIEEYQSAIDYATRGLSLTTDSVQTGSLMSTLGFSQAKLDPKTSGIEIIERSLTFYPHNPYAFINLGLIDLDMGYNKSACTNFRKAIMLGAVDRTSYLITKYCE